MNYIILAAGVGTRLHPLTNENPKCLYKLDSKITIIERTINTIQKFDHEGLITIVIGFQADKMRAVLKSYKNINFVFNPFYKVTNSIASLWFAQEFLINDTTILNADIVFEKALCENLISQKMTGSYVFIDSSIKTDGDYNVQVHDKNITVMSKELKEYYGEYAGITKVDKLGSKKLRDEINYMVEHGYYDQWYENALVQMIFTEDFKLQYIDIADYNWTEVDNVDDLLQAKKIHFTKGE